MLLQMYVYKYALSTTPFRPPSFVSMPRVAGRGVAIEDCAVRQLLTVRLAPVDVGHQRGHCATSVHGAEWSVDEIGYPKKSCGHDILYSVNKILLDSI